MALKVMRGVWAVLLFGLIATAGIIGFSNGNPFNDHTGNQTDNNNQYQRLQNMIKSAEVSKGTGAPALWRLTDSDTEIFLFGTIHTLPKDTKWMTSIVSGALFRSDEIIMEVDLVSDEAVNSLADFKDRKGHLPAGQSLFEQLDVGDAYRLKRSLIYLGEDPDDYDHFQPWLAALHMSQLRLASSGFKSVQGIESYLHDYANRNSKKLHYLETIDEQLAALTHGNTKDQIGNLASLSWTLSQPVTEMKLVTQEWLDGDIHGLGLLVSNPNLGYTPETYENIIRRRNEAWILSIHERMKQPGTAFIAVGAAHLAGPDSLISTLENGMIMPERIQ